MNGIPVLTIEDVATLDGVLGDFLKKAEADLTVVIDRGGNVISQFGDRHVTDVTIIAQGTKFTTPDVTGPAGKTFTIGFQNLDEGAIHNVHIRSAAGADVFTGARVTGVVTTVYHVPALKAGTYPFICDVHPVEMTGTLTVH